MTDERDPLLDPPSWAPSWLPTIDDRRGARALRWIVGALFVAGLAGCVSESADRPADPVVESTTTSTDEATSAPVDPASPTTAPAPDGGSPLGQRFGTIAARLVDAGGEVLELCLLHADTDAERAQGLMQVTDLEGHDGMLFSIDEPSTGAFYMYRTVTPLTIGWFGPDGAFVSRADMAPCASEDPNACERYPAGGPWTSAIEVVQGDPLAARFAPGAALEVTGGACSA